VKRKLYAQLVAAGIVAVVGPQHVYPTIPTAVAAFQARREAQINRVRENVSNLNDLPRG